MASDRSAQHLYWAGVLFAVGSGVHVLDHLRRGQGSVTEPLYWAGNLALIVQVAVITLVLTRHRLAPSRRPPAASPSPSASSPPTGSRSGAR